MKIFQELAKVLQFAPAAVAGIEAIYGEKDTATKTQMALDSLSISSSIASAAEPQYQAQIAVANEMVAAVIAGLQKLHAAGNTPAPASAKG